MKYVTQKRNNLMNIKYTKPGTIVKAHFSRQKYLVISYPVVIRTLQNLIKVVPISETIGNSPCQHQKHILVPQYAKTKGAICLHAQNILNCDQVDFVEKLNDSLADYVIQNV